MKLKLAVATVVISVAMCTSSYGQLLDRMLGRGGCGCEQATSCCDTPARGCGGSLFNLTINMPFSHCGGGCGGGGFFGGGAGLFGAGCGGGCGSSLLSGDCGGCGAATTGCGAATTGCDSGCGGSACGGCGGGLLSGMSGFRLFNRGCGCGQATDCGCNAAPAAAPSCGCESDCGCGFGGGRLRGMFAGFGSRLGNRGCGCEAPAADCGCNAAPMAAPSCGCDNGCGGGLLANLRGRLGNRGCGCRVQRAPRTVCFNVPNFGLLDRLRGNRGCGCDSCNVSGCDNGCGGCNGGQAMPMTQPTPMQGAPAQAVPTETMTPSVQPSVEPVEGSGAYNRTPVVDPNAFIIRGGKYTANN